MSEVSTPDLPRIEDGDAVHLGSFVRSRLSSIFPRIARLLVRNRRSKPDPDLDARLRQIFTTLDTTPEHVAALRDIGEAFTQARGLALTPPEDMSQVKWNRLLRDQGEYYRSASLTLFAGRAEIAGAQLAQAADFLAAHFPDLPA